MIHGYWGVDSEDLYLYFPEYKGAALHWDQDFDTKDLYLYLDLYKSATLGDQGVDTKDPPSLPLGPPNDKQEMAQMLKDE